MAKFIPSISTSSPGAFEQPLQSPLSTSMSSHHQSSERSGWRDEGHDDETAPVEEQAELEQQQGELEDVKPADQDGWMEGAPGQEGGEEGEARWPDETDAELAQHEVDENAVYQEEDEEHKVHHDDQSHLHESEHLETDEGAHGHVQQAEEEGHPEDDPHANGAQQAAASAAQGYVYPHSPASAQQTHPNDSRPASGTSSPYHANGAQAGYASQHLQQPHAASAYAAPYPTTGSQAYYGVPSTHPLQNSHYPTSSLPPSYGSPSSQHQAYPTTSAYGYPPQQPYPTSYNYLGAQSSGSNQYGSSANAYRPSQPMQGHMQHQLSLPHLGAVTSASRTGVDEAGRMSAAHSEHSYDQNDVEGRAELGRLLEGGIGIDPSVQNAVAKNGGVNKAKKRKSEGDALGAEGQYQGEDGSELGGEGEDGEGGGKKRKRASMGDANGGPKDKKHICPECSRGFARAYNLKTHVQTHSPDPPKPHVCPHDSCGHKAFSRSHDLMRHKGSVHGEGSGVAKTSTTPRKKRSPKKSLEKGPDGQDLPQHEGDDGIERSADHMLGAEGLAGLEHHQPGPFEDMDHHQGQYSLQDLSVPGSLGDVGGGGLGGGPEGPFGEFDPQPLHEPYGAGDDNNP